MQPISVEKFADMVIINRVSEIPTPCFYCIHSKNKPPAMQVCPQTALASSKKPPLL